MFPESNHVRALRFLRTHFFVFDWFLLLTVMILAGLGLVTLYSAAGGYDGRFVGQLKNYSLAFIAMWVGATLSREKLMQLAIPLYVLGVLLLLLVDLTFLGDSSKGAERWLNLGFIRIQPSEIMKIAMPLILAWFIHVRNGQMRLIDYVMVLIIIIIPVYLIKVQPDFGTSMLVFSSALFILYFNGISFKIIAPLAVIGVTGLVVLIASEDYLCDPDRVWYFFERFQKERVCTLLDPTKDPFGKGFHIIQSMIAVGSGGVYGKGFMQGTQSHLDFIPEQSTDFIFAVFAEENGMIAAIFLLCLYTALIGRGLWICAQSRTVFCRLLSGTLSMSFLVYVFVNIGMVTGILPVVGVPLPFMSYGGTALITLGFAIGLIMGIHRQTKQDQRD